MKKLLLFTLLTGFGLLSYAQSPTMFSVNTLVQPTGTVYIDGSGNGNVLTAIEVVIQNNDTIVFATGSQIKYSVTLDGTNVDDPTGTAWLRNVAVGINPTETQNVSLTTDWGAQTTPGDHELCVSLDQIVVMQTPFLYSNQDPNKQICATLTFDYTASVGNLAQAEISQIAMNGDFMTVFVKNASSSAQVQIMSITGQVVKTVNSEVGSQNFYQDINVSDLTPGVYIVTVQTASGTTAAKKVVIQ